MSGVVQNAIRPIANGSFNSARRMLFLFFSAVLIGTTNLHGQCPDSGQTKVFKASQGTGYFF